jgi:transposase-like protein
MYKKHPIEEREKVVQECLNGATVLTVARKYGLNRGYVYEWLSRYKLEGVSGLQKRPNRRTNSAEKRKIVCEYAKKGVPLHRLCAEYHVSQSAVIQWTKIFRLEGAKALRDILPAGIGHKGMGRPKKREPQTELERLRYEVEYLRAENALLKKVEALMIEKEKRQRENGRKPSKH